MTHEQKIEELRQMKRRTQESIRKGRIMTEQLRQLEELQKANRAKWEAWDREDEAK